MPLLVRNSRVSPSKTVEHEIEEEEVGVQDDGFQILSVELKTFNDEKGRCLDQFMERYSEKRSYFELSNEVMKFTFPTPGPTEGVKSRSKDVLRMYNSDVQYPTKDKPTIMDVSLNLRSAVWE